MVYGHEGKACDAVICLIEKRDGCRRGAFTFPEKALDRSGAVELTCQIGLRLFAFEHTMVEPFERHFELQEKTKQHFGLIQRRVVSRLPLNETFYLSVPANAIWDISGRKKWERIQDKIVEWIVNVASTLPITPFGRRPDPVENLTIPGVPFSVSLVRMAESTSSGSLEIVIDVTGYNEEKRFERVQRAYRDKYRKLNEWRRRGARSVLIFEIQDIQITNQQLVAEAVWRAEDSISDKPDEIYLLSTVIENSWRLWTLRVGDQVYDDLTIREGSLQNIDPNILRNVTGNRDGLQSDQEFP